MPEMLKEMIGTIVRRALTVWFTWLVTEGWLTSEQTEWLIVGIAGIVATLLWSLYNKWKANKALKAALILPAGSSEEALKDELGK